MESLEISKFGTVLSAIKKRRSSISRRPCPDRLLALNRSFLYLDNQAKLSADRKEHSLKVRTSLQDVKKDSRALKNSGMSNGHGGRNKQAQNESHLKHSNGDVLAFLAPTYKLKGSSIGKDDLDLKSSFQDDYIGMGGEDRNTHEPAENGLEVKFKLNGVGQTLHEESSTSGKNRRLDSFLQLEPTSLGAMKNHPDVLSCSSMPSTKDINKSTSKRGSGDADYIEHEEYDSVSVSQPKRKKRKEESVNASPGGRLEPLTTRWRALQSGKDGAQSSSVQFPCGLPPVPSKKKKERLSEEEKLAKKAEAAQRRKIQMEKAAKESEAIAIRKIRGLNSDKKGQKEGTRANRAKSVNSETSSDNVKLIIGPSGTVLIFPKDKALPSIFDSKPCSYPPQREKCVGPSCTNPYKYRDSRSNLPLCSLLCYRAVQGSTNTVTTC